MAGFFLVLLVTVPIIEIVLFIQLGGAIGAGWTVLLIIATAMIGLSAMRRQGLAVLQSAQQAQAAGRPPAAEIAHGVLILLAGTLLLTPGFLTDTMGFLLLWPAGRLVILKTVLDLVLPSILFRFTGPRAPHGSHGRTRRTGNGGPVNGGSINDKTIIEGDYRVADDKPEER